MFGRKAQAVGLSFLITAAFGFATLLGIAYMVPDTASALKNATDALTQMGVGGTVGSLLLGLLAGIMIAIGVAKLTGRIFGIEIGI